MNRLTRLRLVLPLVLGAAALWAVVSPGCSTTVTPATSGDFSAPGGVAIAPARDRDLVIVTSTGSDELRAITICNTPTLPDGGAPDTTCDPNSDFQFLPGPIRVFPGSFPVGNRPIHIAGLSMLTADGGVSGAVLVAGVAALASDAGAAAQALPAVKLIDTVNMVDAVFKTADAKKAADIALDAPPIDVVAVQQSTPFIALSDAGPNGQPPADAGVPLPGVPGVAFVLTQALTVGSSSGATVPTALSRLTVTPQESGPVGAVTGRCALDIVGARLALVPGSSDKVYVSDATPGPVAGGKGDGVLEIDSTPAAMPAPLAGSAPAPCKILRRFSTVHPVDKVAQNIFSIALSPAWFSSDTPSRLFPTGAFLIGTTADGHVILWRTDTAQLFPLPPFKPLWKNGSTVEVSGVDGVTEARELPDGTVAPVLADGTLGTPYPGLTVPRMEPLRAGQTREVTFLKPPLPGNCPLNLPNGEPWPPDHPCALIRVGPSACGSYWDAQDANLGLIAAAATADGYVRFLDLERGRFVSDARDAYPPVSDQSYPNCPRSTGVPASVDQTTQTLTMYYSQSSSATPATLELAAVDSAGHNVLGWTTAGVSRSSNWFAYYHGIIPGLERRGGTLSRPVQALGTSLKFEMPGQDLTPWVDAGMLEVGDVVAFAIFSNADGSSVCSALQAENNTPFGREYVITGINKSTLTLAASTDGLSGTDGGVVGFDPPLDCLAKPVGASLQFRTAGTRPWLVLQGIEYRDRAASNKPAVFKEPRFDYPIDYSFNPNDLTTLPTADQNIGLSFTIKYDESQTPLIPPGSYFEIRVASGQLPTGASDTGSVAGFAGPMATYSSKKIRGGLLFVAMTGANSLLQVDASLLQVVGGVISYR